VGESGIGCGIRIGIGGKGFMVLGFVAARAGV
jgi:hypothetical protein